MIYLEGLMHKKINIWIALLIIIILAASAAWAISAKAFGGISFGGIIIYTAGCSGSPCPQCPNCGCGGHTEIIFLPFGGDTNYVCPSTAFPYIGTSPVPGFQILGWGFAEKFPIQIGISP